MVLNSAREARFLLVKDSLNAIAQRLGYLNQEQLNQLDGARISDDGWEVHVRASNGIGMRIRHTMEVSIRNYDDPDILDWDFTIDVLGANQCKNCYFGQLGNHGKDVDSLDEEDWKDLLYLPELFADYVALQLTEKHVR